MKSSACGRGGVCRALARGLLVTVMLLCISPLGASADNDWLGLLPLPRSVEVVEDEPFRFDGSVAILCPAEEQAYVRSYLPGGFGAVRMSLAVDPSLGLPAEGYRLKIAPEGVVLRGVDRAGLLNGFHTLLQLFPSEVYEGAFRGVALLPAVEIVDWPEYHYRGQHLDVARTFSTIPQIEEFISHLAHHKINHLHLHLTDDEGWRVEIKSHPELAEIGGWRGGDSPVKAIYGEWEERYGGYYTQEELRSLVAYAHARGVEIVPEIDLPGHSLTIGKIHPEILCPVERDLSASEGYSSQNVWCVAREENYVLLEDIISELCDIFPSEYIHIGGDEVDKSYWRDCPHCSALYRERGMTSQSQLQEYFMERLSAMLAQRGRKAAMWNEATNGGTLSREVRIHGWEGVRQCREVAEAGYPTVVMPGPYFYFDMRQSKMEDGHNWAGIISLKKCYSVSLDALGFGPKAKSNVIGFSGAFWSELYVTHRDKYDNYLEYQTFPRICALSEIGWMPSSSRSWEEFSARLKVHEKRMEAMGISYRRGAPEPPQGRQITPSLKVSTSLPLKNSEALDKIASYANDWGCRTSRTCREGDWILYEFASSVKSGSVVELTTGYRHVCRGVFPSGVVEVSEDGQKFREVAKLHNGGATITLRRPTRAIRIRSTATANGDNYVFIQFPIIHVP